MSGLVGFPTSAASNQTPTADKMEAEDDNGLLSLCERPLENDAPYDDLRTEALGLPHAGACWRLRVVMRFR